MLDEWFDGPVCAGARETKLVKDAGEAHAGGMGEPEDAEPAQVSRVIRALGVVESLIYRRAATAFEFPTPATCALSMTSWASPASTATAR
jgi:hypothetical protein